MWTVPDRSCSLCSAQQGIVTTSLAPQHIAPPPHPAAYTTPHPNPWLTGGHWVTGRQHIVRSGLPREYRDGGVQPQHLLHTRLQVCVAQQQCSAGMQLPMQGQCRAGTQQQCLGGTKQQDEHAPPTQSALQHDRYCSSSICHGTPSRPAPCTLNCSVQNPHPA
jgi:hypothetical protein